MQPTSILGLTDSTFHTQLSVFSLYWSESKYLVVDIVDRKTGSKLKYNNQNQIEQLYEIFEKVFVSGKIDCIIFAETSLYVHESFF